MNKIDQLKPNKITRYKWFGYIAAFIVLFVAVNVFAGTTGKISGYIVDETTGEPIVGANVILEGTYLGAAADIDGYYSINNIPPGDYRVIFSAIGYNKITVEKVLVKIDLTTKLDIELSSTVIQMDQDIVVTSQRPMVQKDLTSTSVTISSEEIKMLPIESIGRIVNLQAGVIDGHFRGGRSNDVAYLIDGVSVTDAYNGGFGVEVENSSIRQMEVISGTFNAEYGQALSGVVNIVTQGGSEKFESYVTAYAGNYVTSNSEIFKNLDRIDRVASRNLQLTFSGPTPVKNLYFFATGRYFKNDGYLYGKRVYNVTDNVPFFPDPMDNTFWIARNTGDGSYVPMNPEQKYSLNGKLTYSLPGISFILSVFYDDNENKYYSHNFSQTPDGMMTHYRKNIINNFQINHYPSANTYQSLKISANIHDYKGYLYENPFDTNYVNPSQGIALSNYTFRSGGNQGGRYARHTNTYIAQYSLSSQITKEHKIGIGVEGRLHELFSYSNDLINLTPEEQIDSLGNRVLVFTPGYQAVNTISENGSHILYTKRPFEFSAYVQDKMEYDIMIINAGVRFDYFNSMGKVPVDLKNLTKNPEFPGVVQDPENPEKYLTQLKNADAKFQISPRLGASFPITDQGIIRFSYGHFFKIPAFENLYNNPAFFISQGQSLSSVIGNADLNAEKNVIYEVGLQQVLFENFAMNVSVYYRDIRNWLGMEIVNSYEGFKYARFVNRDYANVRGFIITLDKRFADYFSAKIDYTFQIAEGNASDPYAVYNNNQTNPPIEETKSVVPLNWDQRHTLNMTVNVGVISDWNIGLIFQYGSGQPYTEDIRVSKGVRFENGGIKPTFYNLDLRAEKMFDVFGFTLNTYLMIYNALDIKNEFGVYSTTGRANQDLNTLTASPVIGLNTIEEYVNDPGFYSTPREIRFGIGFQF